jgi:hypothetical protein
MVTASVVPNSPILVTLMKEALSSSETPALARAIRRNIPEDTSLHSHRREKPQIVHRILVYLGGRRGIKSTITETTYWPIVSDLDKRWL